MDKQQQTAPDAVDTLPEANSKTGKKWTPPRGIRFVTFPERPDRPYGVQWRVQGQRKTKTFPTKEQQMAFAKSLAGDVKRDGLAALRLNADEAREWRAFRAIVGANTDLALVAECWARNKATALIPPLTVHEAVIAYTAAKTAEGVDAASISHYKPIFDRLEEMVGKRDVKTVTGDDIDAFMTRHGGDSKQTRRTRFARVRALFNWLVETKRLASSPFAGKNAPKVPTEEVEILTISQTRQLFMRNLQAEGSDPIPQERRETLGRLAMEAFMGLRHDTAGQIVASEIQPDGLRIPAAKIKTEKNQFLDGLPANVHAWLEWSRPKEWCMTQRQYLEAKTNAFIRAGVPHPHNCLRHGFASYHVAAYKDPGKTSVILCHKSPKLLWDTYRGMASQPDGIEYFRIVPACAAAS